MAENTFKKKVKARRSFSWNINFLGDRKIRVVLGLAFILSAVFLFFSFISYFQSGKADQSVVEAFLSTNIKESGIEVANWFGVIGAVISHYFIFRWFGVAAILIPPFLFIAGYRILYNQRMLPVSRSFVFTCFYLVWLSLLMGYFLLNSDEVTEWGFLSGGIGYEMAIVLDGLTGWGSILLIFFLFTIFNMYFFDVTRLRALEVMVDGIAGFVGNLGKRKVKDPDSEDPKDEIKSVIDRIKQEVEEEEQEEQEEQEENQDDQLVVEDEADGEDDSNEPQAEIELDLESKPQKTETNKKAPEELEMEVEQAVFHEVRDVEAANYDPTLDLPKYKYPTPDLLLDYPHVDAKVTKEELEHNKERIVETLVNFRIGISSIRATIGPTVTLYEIIPEAGVKISKIKNLEDDIALSLSALGIRIIAPIPGRGTIGIEVPNKNREMVDVKSVITTEKFMKSNYELPVVLGKTISNEVYVADLAKMPHLLLAGATGQGKSVGINVMLASLIFRKHPSQLKLILVDPKKVELTLFNNLEKHFLAKLPDWEEAIITDTKQVVNTLHSLTIEMDNRYNLLKDAGCRNLKEYNKKFVSRKLNPNKGHKYLPYIVLVIDELADLMMTAGKEIETPIARLAQLARAIGIHLIVATQRPSVNVITGIIKANFPARISFRVTSKVDSRTILDAGGADQLIGMGDMLLSQGSDIIRLQCAFVDTPEVEEICRFVGEQRGYNSAYQLPEYAGEEEGGIGEVDLADRDSLFEDAARLIVMHQQGSTSLIQRKMKLGYNRAGRLIDQLEAAGIVGPFEGSKAREVLIQDEMSLEQLLSEISNKY